MNILVYDIAAEYGGAITVLNWFYSRHKNDKTNQYIYLLGKYKLADTDNITVINVPEIKKSWLHRLWFDYFKASSYIKKYNIDRVLSLQNTDIPNAGVPQTIYVHNALPFSEHHFKFHEDYYLWIYQNLIGRRIKKSIRNANEIIVQTEWMKEAVIRSVPKLKGEIQILFPEMELFSDIKHRSTEKCIFFYPANSASFKNHKIILDAAKKLAEHGVKDYECVFTLEGNETREISEIYKEAEQLELPFKWTGLLNREKMADWYSKSILLFPSYIETIGLPICEAKSVGAPLLLADCLYAHDAAGDYKDAVYFDYRNADELAKLMRTKIMEYESDAKK